MYGIYHDRPLELKDPRGRNVVDRRGHRHKFDLNDGEKMLRELAKHNPNYRGSPDSMSISSDDFNFYPDDEIILGEVDLESVLGQQLVLWSYKTPDTSAIFTPVLGDTLASIIHFAKSGLDFNHKVEKMTVLQPGQKIPVDISEFYVIKPGSAVLILPRYKQKVSVEIKQLNVKFDMDIDLSMTVMQLKSELQDKRGLSPERMDLLYKDKPMQNDKFLFEYRINPRGTLFVMLHILYDTLVHIETFWGSTYHLYIDPCMTGMNIIWTALRRTVTRNTPDIMSLFELYLPKHTLVLYHGSTVINWSTCMGYYNIDDGDILKLSTIGLYHKLQMQKIPVVETKDKVHMIKVSQFDRWSTVALKLHGLTGIAVNIIKLYTRDLQVDFSETIGHYGHWSPTIVMDVSLAKKDPDAMFGIPLTFRLGNGITEILKVSPNRKVKIVKEMLEQIGVPNATVHDVYVGDYRVSGNTKLVDCVEDFETKVDLKLRQYPVFVHSTQNVIYKMHVYAQESIGAFKKRIEMKTGLSMKSYMLMIAGEDFDQDDEMNVFDSQLGIRSSIFLLPKLNYNVTFVLFDKIMVKLRIPLKAKFTEIKQVLWKDKELPSGCLASVANFLQWFYAKKKYRLKPSERGLILRPGAEGLDALYVKKKRKKRRGKNSFPYKPSLLDEDEALLRLIDEIYTERGRKKKRSFSYPAKNFPSLDDFQQRHKDPKLKRRYRSADDYDRHKKYRSRKEDHSHSKHGHGHSQQKPKWYQQVDQNQLLLPQTTPDEILRISTYIEADNVHVEQDLGWQ